MNAIPSTEDPCRQVLDLLSQGAGLGTIFGYTADEYEALYALGHDHYSQQRYLDAAKCFSFLMAHQSLEPRYMNAFAACMQMLKRYKEAIQYYSTASVLDLEDPLPTFHTAECFIALEMREQASEALTLVVAQCQQTAFAELAQRAQALLELLTGSGAPTEEQAQ
ncbi:MAG: SycD/LcrH family type III secretion system chaperone [Comamonas sp.]|uniref:SycD/LcrH family type III secretion system chaperone n=1 Tax=Comamonas sp. TaxID=34028 RepID=UPI002FC98142